MPVISDIVTTTRASTGTYFDAAGVMQIAPDNVWRQDHDPVTGESLGVLIEEQRTNLALWSSTLSNEVWSRGSTTVEANAAISPDGSMNADILTATGGFTYQTIPVVPGATYTFSYYAKRITIPVLNFAIYDVTNAIFIVNNTPVSVGTDKYTRSSSAFVAPEGCTSVRIYVARGQDGSYIAWGAQLEEGAFPTSHIPTTTAAATRAADALQITNGWSQPWVNSSAGTLLADFQTNENPPRGSSTAGPSVVGQTGTGGMYMHIQGTSPYRLRSGHLGVVETSAFANNQPSVGVGVFAKVASAYAAGEFVIAVNGVAQTFVTSAGNLVKDGDLRIGYRNIANSLNGHIRSISYYPRRLSDAELQAATVMS